MGLTYANRRVKTSTVSDTEVSDNSLAFLQRRMLTYMDRLLNANLNLNKEALRILQWLLNRDLCSDYVKTIQKLVPKQNKPKDDDMDSSIEDAWDFAHTSFDIIKLLSKKSRHRVRLVARKLIEKRLEEFSYDGLSAIEQNIREFKTMFNLDENETELCLSFS